MAADVSPLRGLELEAALTELADAHDHFLHGHCVALALALRTQLGGQLVGVLEAPWEGPPIRLAHAVLEDADAQLIDLRGRRSLEAVLDDFEAWDPWTEYVTATRLRRLNYRGGRIPPAIINEAADVAAQLAPLIRAQRLEGGLPSAADHVERDRSAGERRV